MNLAGCMLQTGMSQRQVARTLKVFQSVVQRMWNHFQI
jgi:predicted XRE-type DNA-binding protein